MRLIKMLGLAAIAALASMAFIASSASADTVCEENVGHTKQCPEAKRVGVGKFITGLTVEGKPATLLSALGNVECHSTVLGKIVENEGEHKGLVGLIESLTFTNCKGTCTSAKGVNLPYKILADALKLHVLVESDGNGAPGGLLEGCNIFGFKVSCLYESGVKALLLEAKGDELIAKEELIEQATKTHSSLCPAAATWDATYLQTLDGTNTPVYLTALP